MASLTFEELSADPKRIDDLTVNEVSAMLVRVSALSMALSARLAAAAAVTGNAALSGAEGALMPDRLLDVDEAAKLLGMSAGTLGRNKDRYPFLVRNGRMIRFSAKGIEKWISRKRG